MGSKGIWDGSRRIRLRVGQNSTRMRVSVKMSTLEIKFLVTMVLNRDMTYDSTDPFLGGRATGTINLVQKYYP